MERGAALACLVLARLILACLAFIVRAGFGLGASGASGVAERFAAGFLPFARVGVLGLRVFGRGGRAGALPAAAALGFALGFRVDVATGSATAACDESDFGLLPLPSSKSTPKR